jgi:hypothetical protein
MSGAGPVHSDLCIECKDGDFSASIDRAGDGLTWRQFLHDALDEWLDKSNNTGYFIVGANWREDSEGK